MSTSGSGSDRRERVSIYIYSLFPVFRNGLIQFAGRANWMSFNEIASDRNMVSYLIVKLSWNCGKIECMVVMTSIVINNLIQMSVFSNWFH